VRSRNWKNEFDEVIWSGQNVWIDKADKDKESWKSLNQEQGYEWSNSCDSDEEMEGLFDTKTSDKFDEFRA
jgi:hypothetical protein